jgi:hypothetical protein
MTDGLSFPELCVPAVGRQPALILRPWRAADIPRAGRRDEPRVPHRWHVVKTGRTPGQDRAARRVGAPDRAGRRA